MNVTERDETIQREAARAAGDLSDLFAVMGEDFRAGRRQFISFNQQSA